MLSTNALEPLLTPEDPPAFQIINPGGTTPLLLVCDHASNYIPAHLNRLGVSTAVQEDHVAWDPGAAIVTERLAHTLNCTAVLGNYSRLLIDTNRDPVNQRDSMIPAISDQYLIPGNQQLTEDNIDQRIHAIHEPYHQAISQRMDALQRLNPAPLLFSIHSFTQQMNGSQLMRPWHAGILWNEDPRMARPLIEHFRQQDHLVIGDNEPYSARAFAYTIDRHGHDRGCANCAIELRQDLLVTEDDFNWWVCHLSTALKRILAIPGIHQTKCFQLGTEKGCKHEEL